MNDSELELSNLKIKEIDLHLTPKIKRVDSPPHQFFQWNGTMQKFQVTDPQNRYPCVELDTLLRELVTKNQAYCGRGWIETMPARADVWCREEVSHQVQNLLKLGGLEWSLVLTKQNSCKDEPRYIVDYVIGDDTDDNIIKAALMPLVLDSSLDATQLNVTMQLVEPIQSVTTLSRTLSVGSECPLQGDAYCNFPNWTQLSPTPDRDLTEFTTENPLVQLPGYKYTFTFPNSLAKFSILYYRNDIRHKLFKTRGAMLHRHFSCLN